VLFVPDLLRILTHCFTLIRQFICHQSLFTVLQWPRPPIGQPKFQNNMYFIQNEKTYFSGGARKWPLRLALRPHKKNNWWSWSSFRGFKFFRRPQNKACVRTRTMQTSTPWPGRTNYCPVSGTGRAGTITKIFFMWPFMAYLWIWPHRTWNDGNLDICPG
jgi:hypothetical protein